ncbi:PriCT-2 domain-containing protein [Sedimentitalea sp.]|uniref:PriCT-2 domain-containing protein n=1 Tax=Sedimentitalea sp. TaxID=2048915 RepID=UPI00329A65A5
MTETYNLSGTTASPTQDVPIRSTTLIRDWLGAGFTDLIPIAPPGAALHENSRVSPDALGKVPSDFYGGAWDSMPGWQTYQMHPILAERWDQLGANVGLRMGDVWCALDVDITDDLLAQAMLIECEKLGGKAWFTRWGQRPKFLVLFRIADGQTIKRRQYPIKMGDQTLRIEVMGKTSKGSLTQAVVGGMHPSGQQYVWNNLPQADAVETITTEQMDNLVEYMLRIAESRGWTRGKASNVNGGAVSSSEYGTAAFDAKLVPPLVDLIPNPELEYDDWVATGYAIRGAMGGGGWELWEAYSKKAQKYDPAATQRAWDTFQLRTAVRKSTTVAAG